MNKKILSLFVLTALLLCTAVFAQADIQVGDMIPFGHYEQDNDLTNGEEPIEWRVLEITDGEALLVSRYALDAMPYNEKRTRADWHTCTMRTFLNGEFLENKFSEDEKAMIVTHEITNYRDNTSVDTIFLLDNTQAKKLFKNHPDRQVTPTAYAATRGLYRSTKFGESVHWWLRSKSWENKNKAAYVATSGGVMTCGGVSDGFVDNRKFALRPALYLNLALYTQAQEAATVVTAPEATASEPTAAAQQ